VLKGYTADVGGIDAKEHVAHPLHLIPLIVNESLDGPRGEYFTLAEARQLVVELD